jgi:cell division septum initiation protein DivIVA
MSSLATNIGNAFLRVATEAKALRTLINGNSPDLSALQTTAKGNLVAAINELVASVGGAGASIDDTKTTTSSVWSSSKVSAEIVSQASATMTQILGGAQEAYDTLKEIKDFIDASQSTDADSISQILAALANRLRFDAAQTLTQPQQAQARANIDAASASAVGNTDADFVAVFEAGLV